MALTQNATIWAAQLKEALAASFVYGAAFTNKDYEGEIKGKGDTVKILKVIGPDAYEYTGEVTWGTLTDSVAATLTIDQATAFSFAVDDVDNEINAIEYIAAGAADQAAKIDAVRELYAASFHASVSSASPDNTYGDSTTPIVIGGGDGEVSAYDAFQELQQRLDEANVPRQGRRTVVPPWYIRRLVKELGRDRASGLGDSIVQNGFAGVLDGVQFYQSNYVPNTSGAKYKIMAGLPKVTWADAIVKVETMRLQNAFATGVRGLYLYGATLTHPEAMALGTYSKGDLTA